jgi:hypothetical protein
MIFVVIVIGVGVVVTPGIAVLIVAVVPDLHGIGMAVGVVVVAVGRIRALPHIAVAIAVPIFVPRGNPVTVFIHRIIAVVFGVGMHVRVGVVAVVAIGSLADIPISINVDQITITGTVIVFAVIGNLGCPRVDKAIVGVTVIPVRNTVTVGIHGLITHRWVHTPCIIDVRDFRSGVFVAAGSKQQGKKDDGARHGGLLVLAGGSWYT